MSVTRRDFIRRFAACSGCFVATASIVVLPGCSLTRTASSMTVASGTSPRFSFPQGIASADPHPDAVVLWTRVADSAGENAVPLVVQVSRDSSFEQVVLEVEIASEPQMDQTLRLFAQGLQPNSWYWFRFVTPDGYSSPVGRTCTAPHPDSEEPLRLAMFSCQSFEAGYFNSYQRLIVDDSQRPLDQQTRLCVHVGDWYYESVGGGMSSLNDVEPQKIQADGSERTSVGIPSGGSGGGRPFAYTLGDFRYLHQQNMSDAGLRRARALYPFVYIWDDHEVRNDYWQSYDNNGPVQPNKLASNQAWFEYCPAALSRAAAGPAGFNPAKDFSFTQVETAQPTEFDENYLSLEPNNIKAISSITIYRTLKWGKTADLFLVDGRSYRGRRGVDDAILGPDVVAYPNQPIPPELVDVMAEGREYNGGNPPETLMFQGAQVPNPRKDAPATSLLGGPQKDWLKQSLANSSARWKVLCNNVPMMRFGFDNSFMDYGGVDGIYFSDSWDGYPNERRELMAFIRDQGIANVISLTGDRHAHYAGFVCDDYRKDNPFPVMAELVGASISAACRQSLQERLARGDEFFQRVAVADAGDMNYLYHRLPVLNVWMLFGAEAAMQFIQTRSVERAQAQAKNAVNPHLFYADNDAYGYFRVVMDNQRCAAEFVTEPQPVRDHTLSANPPLRRRIRVDVPVLEAGEPARFENWSVEGEPPLLGLKF